MIVGTNTAQGQLFTTPFEQELDLYNRWVSFSKLLPWDKLSGYYYSRMDKKMGAGTIDARIVLGALIIKHHEGLSDEGTIESIQENVYMQYFLGLPSFKREAVFVPSLFVEIRKRLGIDYWKDINESSSNTIQRSKKKGRKMKATIQLQKGQAFKPPSTKALST